MTESVKLKATVMWANLSKPNDMSGKYQLDLANLSDAAVSALEDMGLTVRQKDTHGYFITAKSSNPIKAFDKQGEEIEGTIVGNGSTCIAVVGFYDWKYKSKEGRSPSLKRLVIDKLEVYGDDVGELAVADIEDDEVL
jgi:hypothetical protein